MSSKNIEKETKKIFSKIHPKQYKSKKIFGRLNILFNHSFFKVNKNFFKNKICLDAASGTNLNATLNLLKLGAKYVYSCDFNTKLKKITKNEFKPYKKKYEVKVANIKKLPYEDEFFDFVLCKGAIHHTTDYKKSIDELCRVTKKEGYIYLEAYGSGGIIREITSFLRKKIIKDKAFKKEIVNLNKTKVVKLINYMTNNNFKKKIDILFDEDLVLTIKDRLLSPLYEEFSDVDIKKILKKNRFYQIKRLKRKPHFSNVRKYLINIYENYNTQYAKFLYGSGMPCIFAKKR
tara:strand:- start:910 stop:1779 length:870 start_codon:yes stop_codon:yes gene_type:complete